MGLFTNTLFEFAETHPLLRLVTVNEYELTGNPVKEVETPTPDCVKVVAGEFPYAVIVHLPVLGKFEIGTLPVATTQVG